MTPKQERKIVNRTARHVRIMWTRGAKQVTVEVDRNGWAQAHYAAEGRYWISFFDGAGDCFTTDAAEARGKKNP
tara:strand:+ start:215 stop:436 length:222 start_codon:yes stop_codon:yes gene_type:complete